MLIDEVRGRAREACLDKRNTFGPAFFDEHLVVVAQYASKLARPLGADPEAVTVAAYLHDLSAVYDAATLPVHAQASAELAERTLREFACPDVFARSVCAAIAAHSTPLTVGSAAPESVCLSNADAVARMARPAYWLYFAFAVRKLPFAEGRAWLGGLFEREWALLTEEAREIARADYAADLKLLAGSDPRT